MQLPASQDFAAAAAAARYALISPGALKLTAYAPASGAAEVLLPAKPLTLADGARAQKAGGREPGDPLPGGRRDTPAAPPPSRHPHPSTPPTRVRALPPPPRYRYFVLSNLTGGRAVKPSAHLPPTPRSQRLSLTGATPRPGLRPAPRPRGASRRSPLPPRGAPPPPGAAWDGQRYLSVPLRRERSRCFLRARCLLRAGMKGASPGRPPDDLRVSAGRHGAARYGTVQYSTVPYGTVWYGAARQPHSTLAAPAPVAMGTGPAPRGAGIGPV